MGFRDFLDNARREASSMAHGAIPGAMAIGGATYDDLYQLMPGKDKKRQGGRFQLDDVARTATQEFARQSPILPLLQGHFKEAGHRFYERPISSTLDLLGAGSVADQGLRLAGHIPGDLGVGAMRLRGYRQLDPTTISGDTIGELPAQFKFADGSTGLGREYLLRPDIHSTPNGVFARQTMRSPRSSGDTGFDAQLETNGTLADDHLINQSTPRARYEPIARLGDMMNFTPKIGSARFGKRLAIRNRSRLKISSQEMMAEFGRTRKQYRKDFGENADDHVGKALFLASAGIENYDDLASAMERFTPSGRKAILKDDKVDLLSTEGQQVELFNHELDIAQKFVHDRDQMARNLADNIAKHEERGFVVAATGDGDERILSPGWVTSNPQKAYELVSKGNLHLKRVDRTVEPTAPGEQGQLFGDHGRPQQGVATNDIEMPDLPNEDQGKMFSNELDKFGHLDAQDQWRLVNGEYKMRDPKTGEWVDPTLQRAALPKSGIEPDTLLHEKMKEGDAETRTVLEKSKFDKTATDEEIAAHDEVILDPIKEVWIDEELRKLGESGQEITNQQLDRIMRGATEAAKSLDPDSFRRIGKHGVEGRIYRYMVDEIQGVDEYNRILDYEDFQKWAAEHGDDFEDLHYEDGGEIPPTPPAEPKLMDGEFDPADLKELRRQTAEDYSKAAWFKNYLDNLVSARTSEDSSDVVTLFKSLHANPDVKKVLESDQFQQYILPSHKLMVAAQLEADKVRLGANALSQQNVFRNNERLAMLTGKEGKGIFHVARRPRTRPVDVDPRTEGELPLEVIDENLPGDPAELIARGDLDTQPQVHLSNYLRRRREAASQELVDSVADSAVVVSPLEAKAHIQSKQAMYEDQLTEAGNKERPFTIIRPHGELFKRIEAAQPLANTAARRLREDGYYDEAANIQQAAKEMYEASKDGDFSLGDMIRNSKLRGELEDTHYMVPTDMYKAILNEVTESTNALSSFLQGTSTAFKISVLHGRWPGWVVNNTIGSQLYLAMTGGLGATIPHAGSGKLVTEMFPDVLGAGSREMATGAEDLGRVATGRVDKLMDTKVGKIGSDVINTLSDWNQKIADEPARIVRIEQVIEDRFQNLQKLAKASGREIPDTLDARRKMFMDPKVREDIAAEVLDDMIDFTTLSKSERMWVSNIIPFWTFVKGSTKSAQRLVADHPGRMWLPGQVAGYGSERTDEQFPEGTPEYMRALVPTGNEGALQVGGWNPWGQQAQLLGGALSMSEAQRPTGQEHPLSLLNPVITAPYEAVTNRDAYTDYPLTGNVALNLLGSLAESFPIGETAAQVASPHNTGRGAFMNSRKNSLLNFVGIPIREVNRGNLATRASADENRRKKNGIYDYWRFHDGV